MKKSSLVIFFVFISSFLQAQQAIQQELKLKNLKELPPSEWCYTFPLGDSMTVSICKLDATTQLTASGPTNFWIGKNAYGVKHSDIVITFSKPVTSLNFIMSHFNFDVNGGEFLNGFTIYSEDGTEIKSSVVDWQTGSAVSDSSSSFATVFNKKTRTIRATSGGWGPETGGRLYVSSHTPFTRFTMHQEVVYGYPNGIIISDEINFTTTPIVVEKEIKQEQQPKDDTLIASTIKKDSTLLVKERMPVAKVDSIKKENSKPVEKKQPVIKKPAPKKITVAKVTEKKAPPKKEIAKKIPPIKTEVKKAPVKKKPITPAVVKKEVKQETKPEQTHQLSQVRSVDVGEKIKLEKVFFKQSLPELLPGSYPELDTLVNILKEQKTLEIEIQGHTDDQGVPSINQQLSEKRVEAVKAYLVSKGIAPERLTGKGFGGTQPCIDNEVEEHRKQNRRVEFMITKK